MNERSKMAAVGDMQTEITESKFHLGDSPVLSGTKLTIGRGLRKRAWPMAAQFSRLDPSGRMALRIFKPCMTVT